MKKLLLSLAALFIASALNAENPVANPKSVVVSGNARFTVLTPEMIRMEYSPSGKFEDRATFSVVNRELPDVKYSSKEKDGVLTITTPKLSLRYKTGTNPLTSPASADNLSIQLKLDNGETVEWFPGKEDPQNLKGTYRTLDRNEGDAYRSKLENGVVSRSGWAVIDDSPSFKRADGSGSLALEPQTDYFDWVAPRADKDALDLYFMGYGHDYKKAIKDFTRIAGKIPLPPDFVFGYWYSKYMNYTSQDFRDIMAALKEHDINTDVLIMDMDWHWNGRKEDSNGRGGWTGWTWNTKLIPDPEKLIADMHANGMRTALNLHPADGIASDEDFFKEICSDLGLNPAETKKVEWNLENKAFAKSFFNRIIRAREAQGVDFWWLDWQQHLLNKKIPTLGETMWCNHVFFNEMKRNRPDRRPVIFHRWGGLGSHRYQLGFSGDSHITFPTLAFLPYFTATASNVGYGYWGHDLGGHTTDRKSGFNVNDPELLLRWIQYGVFSPIFRTHSTKGGNIERRIWKYDNFDQMNQAVKLRYSLFPYIYTMARNCYDTGLSICYPLYYEYPEAPEAYTFEGQYFFGKDILVAPVTEPSVNGRSVKKIWFPQGEWWSPVHNKLYAGNRTLDIEYALDEIPYFYRRGAVIFRNPESVKRVTERPDHLLIDIVSAPKGEGSLYEDSGDSQNYDKEFAVTKLRHSLKGSKGSYELLPREGSYTGMKEARGYTMRIYDTKRPKGAKINGKPAEFSYDAASRCTTVSVPTAPCSAKIKVDVNY